MTYEEIIGRMLALEALHDRVEAEAYEEAEADLLAARQYLTAARAELACTSPGYRYQRRAAELAQYDQADAGLIERRAARAQNHARWRGRRLFVLDGDALQRAWLAAAELRMMSGAVR